MKKAGDVYQYHLSDDYAKDYTGTHIKSDKKIAVFSGNISTKIPSNRRSGVDMLLQQLHPINIFGKNYAYIPFAGFRTGSLFRIIAQADDTKAYIGNEYLCTLKQGEFYTSSYEDTHSENAEIIHANKPISVAQFGTSSQYNHGFIWHHCCTKATHENLVGPNMVILTKSYETWHQRCSYFCTNKRRYHASLHQRRDQNSREMQFENQWCSSHRKLYRTAKHGRRLFLFAIGVNDYDRGLALLAFA